MKITILPAANGATVIEDYEEEGVPEKRYVFAFDEEVGLGDLEIMLWQISETVYGPSGKKSKERISIRVVHGSDYECKDKKCGICRYGKL
jgi:hypothetical protein